MHIEINYRNLEGSESLEAHVRERVESATAPFAGRVTRVEVHLGDESSGSKHTPQDKRVLFEARAAGHDPIVVEDHADDFYAATSHAAGKLRRALDKKLQRRAG